MESIALSGSGTVLSEPDVVMGLLEDSNAIFTNASASGMQQLSPLDSGGSFQASHSLNMADTSVSAFDHLSLVTQPTALSSVATSDTSSGAQVTNAPDDVDLLTGFSESASAALVGGSAKINFQPDTASLPSGYTKDSGLGFDATRGFGWVRQDSLSNATRTPINIAAYARDRNTSGVEQRLDTLLHMQYPGAPAAAWEYALANGTYSVTVSAGDQATDSQHRIRVEGVEAIRPFAPNSINKYELGTVTVNVTDGKLTVDALGGTNTKINYIEIKSVSSGSHPSVTGSSPTSREQSVFRNADIGMDVSIITAGAGVDLDTLNTTNVRLYRTRDNTLVSGTFGTSGGNDAIVYNPSVTLDANTHYTLRVTDGVKDEAGVAFLPFSTTFTTGTVIDDLPFTSGVNFTKTTAYEGSPISTVIIGPNNRLYAAGLDGTLRRWNVNPSNGQLTGGQTFNDQNGVLTGRAIIGLAFNPNISDELYLWTSNNAPLFPQPAEDFSGKVSKISLNGGATQFTGNVDDFIVGLPRSAKDHLSNSLVYGPDNRLYMTQGSNTAMGAPDAAWFNRPERLLTASVLRIDQYQFETRPPGGFNVQTENYVNTQGQLITNPQGNYNPYIANAPVQIYASGVRNAYDLVWHTNGNLYVPTNGSAAGGNTPDNPATATNEGLTNVATQNDYLFKVQQGGYYGHPNPKRGQYILNGGNPTSGVDAAEVVAGGGYAGYPVGTQPDPNYGGFAWDFGRNRSPNGIIEYKSTTFGGALQNDLLVVEYSGGDRIVSLDPDANGNIPSSGVTQIRVNGGSGGFTDPVDLIEDTRNGNLYVVELIGGGTSSRISLLRPA
jgi:glucose/arabinose dehydrogenase